MTQPSDQTLEALRAPLDQVTIRKVWRGVDQRRQPARLRWFGGLAWGLAGAAITAGVIALVHARSGDGPVRLPDGEPLQTLATLADEARRTVALSDGSVIALEPDTELAALSNGDREVTIVVKHGRVTFDVHPNGPRRWILACDDVIVDVIGTRFELECGVDATRVAVHRGLVRVRGERVRGGSIQLGPNERFEARAVLSPSPSSSASGPVSTSQPPPTPAPAESTTSEASIAGSKARSALVGWRALAAERQYADAYRTLGPEGVIAVTRGSNVEDLFAVADVARLSGHHAEAELALQAIVNRHPNDARASVAALTLGRMYLGPMGRASAAAQMLSRALALGLPGALREDALGRLVEAYGRAGDASQAKSTAKRYLRLYPSGRHREAVSKWMAEDAGESVAVP